MPEIVRVEVPDRPPSVTQNGKLLAVTAEDVVTVPLLPALVEVEYLLPLVSNRLAIVALVDDTLVEETLLAVTNPVELILNLVDEFTWKFTKSPLKVEVGLIPKYVPEALPP